MEFIPPTFSNYCWSSPTLFKMFKTRLFFQFSKKSELNWKCTHSAASHTQGMWMNNNYTGKKKEEITEPKDLDDSPADVEVTAPALL